MAVKASVDTQNQTTVRVGQQNAIKVTSTQTGIASAVSANTATNVVGGRADVTQLAVSGLSTFTGIVTTVSDLYVGGDLYLTDDLVLDNISGNSLTISGISSVGFITATDVWVSGAVTATTYYGDGQNLIGVGNTLNVSTNSLVVLGISTIGVTSATNLEAQQLSVSGVTTHYQDVQFPGAAYNILWDQATSKFKFDDSAQCVFGSASGGDLKIFHQSGNSSIRNETGQFRIAGNDIRLQTQNHSEDYLLAVDGGSVSIFYDDVKRLETSGIGITVTGVTSTTDLYVTGSTTVGFITATDVWVSGAVTATTYYGDGSNLVGAGNTANVVTDSLVVSGVSTFADDVEFHGSSGITSATWDKSASNLIFNDGVKAIFGTSSDGLEIYHSGSKSLIADTGTGGLEITGNTLQLRSHTGEYFISMVNDSSVWLRHDNIERLQTTGLGVSVYGTLDTDQLNVSGVSTFAGITTVTGTTLFSKQLSVSGFSTYIGVATYKDDVFIDGTLTAGAIDGGTY